MKEFSVENLLFVTEVDLWRRRFLKKCCSVSNPSDNSETHTIDIQVNNNETDADNLKAEAACTFQPSLSRQKSKLSEGVGASEAYTLENLKYLHLSPIMKEPMFGKSVLLMIDIFIKDNSSNEINIAGKQKKNLFKNEIVVEILSLRNRINEFDETTLTTKDLKMFDDIQNEVLKNLKDSFQRFVKTTEYTTLVRHYQENNNNEIALDSDVDSNL